MRILPATVCAVTLLSGMAVATADPASGVACAVDDGRERLTEDTSWSFEAPGVTAPELAATREVTGDTVTTFREAKFPLLVDAAPATATTVGLDLFWKRPSDYDLYVLDDEGQVLASSDAANLQDGTTAESISGLELAHCEAVTVVVRSWAGAVPLQELFLTATTTPGTKQLACLPSDPALGCAGRPAGASPSAVTDTRTRLFLAGDPGQASMASGYQGTQALTTSTLAAERPRSGVPNSYTRPVIGFRDQLRNPFVPHFTGRLPSPRDVVGSASALVWVSSPTLHQGGTLHVDLYVDDALVGSVPVPGTQVGAAPTPVAVSFPELNVKRAESVTLQLGTTPTVSSSGPGQPGDAVFTVHYGGVQFPSRLTLP